MAEVGARWPSRLAVLTSIATSIAGVGAAIHYARVGLTLSHYDAKAHLVVSRRILDSLTPGWEQIGAVWLPLPHLLNMVPAQWDVLYRTGAFAIAVSIAAHAVAAGAIAWTVRALTGSVSAAVLAAALFALNPNTLYLQSTAMTEPLLFGLMALQVALVTHWVVAGRLRVPYDVGWVTVLACLTRYEAWPVTAMCFAAAAFAWWQRGHSLHALMPAFARLAVFPVVTVLAFIAFSRITVGEWFVSGGFFVPDESLRGEPVAVLGKIAEGTALLGGEWLLWSMTLAIVVVGILAVVSPGRTPMLIPLSLLASAALPLSAYLSGHPFRIRYEISLVVAGAVAVGMGVGLLRRVAFVAAGVLGVLVLREVPPFSSTAPMVLEAQLDRNVIARREVTECLKRGYRGGAVMMSMGSLGHYMHELAADGFAIRDFLHEGNGPLWDSAFTRGPAPLVEWVLVEEDAEGGDAIVQRLREVPALLAQYDRVCASGGVALYKRRSSTRGE